MVIDVVLSGNLRSEVAFFQVMRECLTARSEGLVGKIVFSTWGYEVGRYPRLFDMLARLGVDVVTSEMPERLNDSLSIQTLQFWRGLQSLDGTAGWVLRTRTDRALIHTVQFLDGLRSGKLRPDQLAPPSDLLRSKVIVPAVSVNEPFVNVDIVFLLEVKDARRLINFDMSYDLIYNDTGTFPVDCRWFCNPVLSQHAGFKELLERVNMPRVASAMQSAAQNGTLMDAPEALFRYLGAYWPIAHDLFALVDQADHGPSPLLEDVLASRVVRPFALILGESVATTSQQWLTSLATDETSASEVVRRAAAWRVSPERYGSALEQVDPEALNAFAAAQLGPAPASERGVKRFKGASIGGAESLEQMFASLVREPFEQTSASEAFRLVEAAAEAERRNGGTHVALYEAGCVLEAEARSTGDQTKAQIAFMLHLSAAWARLRDAADRACGLAFDGLVGPEQRKEAFAPAHLIWSLNQDFAPAVFWYGIVHMTPWASEHVNYEHGMSMVQRAADLGSERAQKFLTDPVLPT